MKTIKTAIAAGLIAASLSVNAGFLKDFTTTAVEGVIFVVIGTGVVFAAPFWVAGEVYHVLEDEFKEGV